MGKASFVTFWKITAVDEEQEDGTMITKQIPLLRYYNVFHISQVDGVDPLPEEELNTEIEPIEEAEKILSRVKTGLKDICTDADLVVEAALEDMAIKKQTFKELQDICKEDAIFATNTSSLSITEIGAGLDRPMIGMHFFNPADRMKLIEVIAGVNTPAETVEAIKKISVEIGKTPVQVNEAAGFVVNRILIPMINEAAFIKMEGVSDIAGIDAAMKLGANHPMGPLELGDFIGLDICLAIMDVLYNETGDSKYRACPLIRKMVRGGNLGVKSGKGFYIYNADRTKTPVDAQ